MLSRTKVGSGSKFGVEAAVYFQKHCCLLQLGLQESCNVLLSLGSRILAVFCFVLLAWLHCLMLSWLAMNMQHAHMHMQELLGLWCLAGAGGA